MLRTPSQTRPVSLKDLLRLKLAIQLSAILMGLMPIGSCASGGKGPFREYNPPWLMAWDGPREVRNKLDESISIGMTRDEVETPLRRRGVKDWNQAPPVYHDCIAVTDNSNEPAFRFTGRQNGVPHGNHNYAVYQADRIAISVPSYRGVPKRSIGCVMYPMPEFGVATILFDGGAVSALEYVPLPGDVYSEKMYIVRLEHE